MYADGSKGNEMRQGEGEWVVEGYEQEFARIWGDQ